MNKHQPEQGDKMKQIFTKLERARTRGAGFTLIELLVVMAVIMVLAALMLKGFGFMSAEAKNKACYAKMARIASAMDEYYRDTGQYTANMNLLVPKYLDASDLIDPWGTPFSINLSVGGFNGNQRQITTMPGGPFGISSLGANRVGDSVHAGRDDLSWPYQ
jgi:general secretion pathway protein G